MSRTVLNCGYVPLVDSAPLILAKELGFAAAEGISLNLLRQPSWAALRDLLALGHLDVAHMLAPMPIAMTLGLSGPAVAIDAPMVLSVNGTVVGVSTQLAAAMRANGWQPDITQPAKTAKALLAAFERPLRIGVPFPFSMHRLLLEYLIDSVASQSPAFSIVATPPPLMADAIKHGDIDLFCVGEPWGTVAVSSGAAELILPGAAIWAHAPEKVLGMRRDWLADNDTTCGALLRAMYSASLWLGQPENRSLASEILARSEHLDIPDHAIDPALTGRIVPNLGQPAWQIDNFIKFHEGATTFPWRSQGAWIGAQISRLHRLDLESTVSKAANCLRPDLYRSHLGERGVDMPGASAKVEGSLHYPTAVASARGELVLGTDMFFDGKTFDFSAK